MAAVNVASLAGNAIAFRFVDPVSMGVWHTLVLVCGYLTIARLGVVNGLGRELPFALGRGDTVSARRIAAAGLAANHASAAAAVVTFAILLAAFWTRGPVWRWALCAMAVVSTATFHLTFLQATFRSDADFTRLARVHWIQAGAALLMAPAVVPLRLRRPLRARRALGRGGDRVRARLAAAARARAGSTPVWCATCCPSASRCSRRAICRRWRRASTA